MKEPALVMQFSFIFLCNDSSVHCWFRLWKWAQYLHYIVCFFLVLEGLRILYVRQVHYHCFRYTDRGFSLIMPLSFSSSQVDCHCSRYTDLGFFSPIGSCLCDSLLTSTFIALNTQTLAFFDIGSCLCDPLPLKCHCILPIYMINF